MKKKDIGLILIFFSLLLLPGMQVLFIIGCNSNTLINISLFSIISLLNVILVVTLIIGLVISNKTKKKIKKWLKALFIIFMIFYIVGCIFFITLLYGPSDKFRNWLITTAMGTKNHQYICEWFYNEKQIKDVMDQNYIVELEEDTDPDLIKDEEEILVENYNEYETELLIHEEDELYKIVKFEVNGADAYIVAIFDPSKLSVESTSQIGHLGEYVTKMAERNNAILALNAGGFVDNGRSLGEYPTGITIKNGQIITNNEYDTAIPTGGIIGLTNDNVLVLLKNKTAEEAIEMGVRDAVSWGPFLIVNGTAADVSGNGGYGKAARSVIGQRTDGTILLLQVGSDYARTTGAGMKELIEIMQRYGAYNAANLDGGTSSVLALRRDIAISEWGATCHDYFTKYSCAINDAIDSAGIHQTRYVSTAWVLIE